MALRYGKQTLIFPIRSGVTQIKNARAHNAKSLIMLWPHFSHTYRKKENLIQCNKIKGINIVHACAASFNSPLAHHNHLVLYKSCRVRGAFESGILLANCRSFQQWVASYNVYNNRTRPYRWISCAYSNNSLIWNYTRRA